MPSPQQTEVKKNFKIQENISVVQDWNMTQLLNRETELIFCKIFSTNISQLYLEQRDLVSELKVCRLNQEFKQTGKALSTEKFKNPTFWKKYFEKLIMQEIGCTLLNGADTVLCPMKIISKQYAWMLYIVGEDKVIQKSLSKRCTTLDLWWRVRNMQENNTLIHLIHFSRSKEKAAKKFAETVYFKLKTLPWGSM